MWMGSSSPGKIESIPSTVWEGGLGVRALPIEGVSGWLLAFVGGFAGVEGSEGGGFGPLILTLTGPKSTFPERVS